LPQELPGYFEPNARTFVGGLLLKKRENVGHAIAPVTEDARRGRARLRVRRSQHALQQRLVNPVVPLPHPQRFQSVVLVLRVLRIERAHPGLERRHDLVRVAAAQLDLHPVPHAVLGLFQQVEQPRHGLPRDPRRL